MVTVGRSGGEKVSLSLPSSFIQFVRTDGDKLERPEPEWQKIHAAAWRLLD